jgi:phosphatidylglycerol:prolipoprotein diacylglycerol transferase
MAALGMLLALALAVRTSRIAGVNPNQIWNISIVSLSTALAGSRLLLVAVNWTVVRTHPTWLLGLAMIHHPLLAAVGALLATAAAALYARKQHMPLGDTADVLAAPLALGVAFEQFGALLAGSGFGRETNARWGVTYTNPLAARWSGAPLGITTHPVQAYAGLAFLVIALVLLVCLPLRRQRGDIAGVWLLAAGVAVYFTEFWRDPEGRGAILHGALNGPQLAAIGFVLGSAFVLHERDNAHISRKPDLGTTAAATVIRANEAPHAGEIAHE